VSTQPKTQSLGAKTKSLQNISEPLAFEVGCWDVGILKTSTTVSVSKIALALIFAIVGGDTADVCV